jgi:hypothetical protein
MTARLAPQQISPAHPDRSQQAATPVIAFLGTGRMGGPMAANLARAGFEVRTWDRTVGHAAAFIEDGATVAASPAGGAPPPAGTPMTTWPSSTHTLTRPRPGSPAPDRTRAA